MLNKEISEFTILAEKTIDYLASTIEDQDPEGILEVDFLGDMLNIISPAGQYVINKHTAAREIWLASPKTGPYHFAYNSSMQKWIDSKGVELLNLLEQELKEYIKIDLFLK
ncbi:MAG: cyaY [Rickettsiaceae bacterium]|jgi:CyaY protein|nr:cyaY [Rickettsiaceae bacterium]